MSEPSPLRGALSTQREQEHLETAHHEICTALTVLQSNVELVRVELRHEGDPGTHVTIQRHLTELDMAVERLRRLAEQMRSWHRSDAIDPGAQTQTRRLTRILP